MWSHQSPLWSSAGSSGSQWACFLATKDHFSSSWISWVSGGKAHEFVVEVAGMRAGFSCQPHDGVAMDAGESFGLPDPIAIDQMFEDGDHGLLGQARVEQRGALAFGEAGLADLAGEQADLLVLAVALADHEVAGVALAVERAIGVLAAEASEVVHGWRTSGPRVQRGNHRTQVSAYVELGRSSITLGHDLFCLDYPCLHALFLGLPPAPADAVQPSLSPGLVGAPPWKLPCN